MVTRYITTEVAVDLSEFDAEDLLEELEGRAGFTNIESRPLLEKIWLKRRTGQNYEAELDKLLYSTLGKVI